MATERVTQEMASQTPEGPVMCNNGCGFFGSASTMGLCSKCYRETVVQAKSTSAATAQATTAALPTLLHEGKTRPEVILTHPQSASPQGEVIVEAAETSTPAVEQPRQPAPNRCGSCRKRVGLTGFKCRCGSLYCSLHRYSDKHSCTYDYKAAGQEAIAKANPVVVAEKVVKF